MDAYVQLLKGGVLHALKLGRRTYTIMAVGAVAAWTLAVGVMAVVLATWSWAPAAAITGAAVALATYGAASVWSATWSTSTVWMQQTGHVQVLQVARHTFTSYVRALRGEGAMLFIILGAFAPAAVCAGCGVYFASNDETSTAAAFGVVALAAGAAAAAVSVWWWARHCVVVQAAVTQKRGSVLGAAASFTENRTYQVAGAAATVSVVFATVTAVLTVGVVTASAVAWMWQPWFGAVVFVAGRAVVSVLTSCVYNSFLTSVWTEDARHLNPAAV